MCSILWHRLDQPGYESARLASEGKNWRLAGTAVFQHDKQPCRLDYSILCDALWHTIAARVAGWVGEEQVAIVISVDKAHHWWMNGGRAAKKDIAAIKDIAAVAGCLDLDLNFSPVTNTLPIRRLALEVGQTADVRAAWLRFPSFKLELLEQRYSRIDATTYRYESAGGRFVRDLQVDDSGLITDYPGFWQLEATTGPYPR